jgi:hypothetical protein
MFQREPYLFAFVYRFDNTITSLLPSHRSFNIYFLLLVQKKVTKKSTCLTKNRSEKRRSTGGGFGKDLHSFSSAARIEQIFPRRIRSPAPLLFCPIFLRARKRRDGDWRKRKSFRRISPAFIRRGQGEVGKGINGAAGVSATNSFSQPLWRMKSENIKTRSWWRRLGCFLSFLSQPLPRLSST